VNLASKLKESENGTPSREKAMRLMISLGERYTVSTVKLVLFDLGCIILGFSVIWVND
jgi:hypothetical protein